MGDQAMAIMAVCIAAVLISVMDIATITDKVNRKFNEVANVRGLVLRVGRLSSTLPMALGFMLGHWLFSKRAIFSHDGAYFFCMVGTMVSVGLLHGLSVRRIMFPSWFALVYIFLGLLLGSTT